MSLNLGINLMTSELANGLGLEYRGPNMPVRCVAPISSPREFSLVFSNDPSAFPPPPMAITITTKAEETLESAIILSDRPRLDFARALSLIIQYGGFSPSCAEPLVHPTAVVGKGVRFGAGVVVGARTVIHHNVVIGDEVVIGEDCVIKSNTVIGEQGFGFERDESKIPIRMPHLGRVLIGNNVEIGSLNTICRGTLSDTVIGDHVKTDDHVHIAHNCIVRRGSIITACAELSGGVTVGEFAWIGPNCSILQKVCIGDEAFVGIAANVTKDVMDRVTVAGNPARVLRGKAD